MSLDDDHDDIHLAMHREADELGKFASHLAVRSPRPLSQEETVRFLDELLYQVTKECMDHGADLVGHVKAFLRSEDGAMSASLIDIEKRSNVTHDFSHGATFLEGDLTLHVIVHGIWDDVVKDSSQAAMERVFEQFGIEHTVLKDYYDTEKSISHHMK
jgi:hypothetical protein